MAPVGNKKEIHMSDVEGTPLEVNAVVEDLETDVPVVPVDAEPIPAGDDNDHSEPIHPRTTA